MPEQICIFSFLSPVSLWHNLPEISEMLRAPTLVAEKPSEAWAREAQQYARSLGWLDVEVVAAEPYPTRLPLPTPSPLDPPMHCFNIEADQTFLGRLALRFPHSDTSISPHLQSLSNYLASAWLEMRLQQCRSALDHLIEMVQQKASADFCLLELSERLHARVEIRSLRESPPSHIPTDGELRFPVAGSLDEKELLLVRRDDRGGWSHQERAILAPLGLWIGAALWMQQSSQTARPLVNPEWLLQKVLECLMQAGNFDAAIRFLLHTLTDVLGPCHAAFYEQRGGRVFLRYWYLHDRGFIYPPECAVPARDLRTLLLLANGFQVPDEYLGINMHAVKAVFLNHWNATTVPEFHQFVLGLASGSELNVGVGIQDQRQATLCLYRPTGQSYSPEEINLITTIGNAIALAQAGMKLQKNEHRAQLRQVSSVVKEVFLEDRPRIQCRNMLTESLAKLLQSCSAEYLLLTTIDAASRKVFLWELQRSDTPQPLFSPELPKPVQLQMPPEGIEALSHLPIMALSRRSLPFVIRRLPSELDWLQALPLSDHVVLPLLLDGTPTAVIHLLYTNSKVLRVEEETVLQATLEQVSLLIELQMMAEAAAQTRLALAEEANTRLLYEQAARANRVLSRSLFRMADEQDLDLAPLIVMKEMARLARADICTWFEYNEATRQCRRTYCVRRGQVVSDWEEGEPEYFRSFSVDAIPGFENLIRSDAFLWTDLRQRSSTEWPGSRAYHLRHGRKYANAFAIRLGNKTLGLMGMAFTEDARFTADQESLTLTLAKQFALALGLVRRAETRRALEMAKQRQSQAEKRVVELRQINEVILSGIGQSAEVTNLLDLSSHVLRSIHEHLATQCVEFWMESDGEKRQTLRQPADCVSPCGLGPAVEVTTQFSAHIHAGLVFHFPKGHVLLPEESESVQAMANQLFLALHLQRLSKEAETAAVARERELAAESRAALLERVNQALQDAASSLTTATTPEDYLRDLIRVAHGVVRADSVALFFMTESTRELYPVTSYPEELPPHGSSTYPLPQGTRLSSADNWDLLCSWESPRILDPETDAEHFLPATAAWHRAQGHRTIVVSVMRMGNRPTGFLAMAFCEKRVLTDSERQVTVTLTNHAAVARELMALMERAKLAALAEERNALTQARLEELGEVNRALNESAKQLVEIGNLSGYANNLIDTVVRLLRADCAAFYACNTEAHTMEILAGHYRGASDIHLGNHHPIQPGRPFPLSPQPMYERFGPNQYARLYLFPEEAHEFPGPIRDWHIQEGHSSILLCPLLLDRKVLGLIVVSFLDRRTIHTSELQMITALNTQAALAIELQRLHSIARTAAIVEERNYMAREIHDNLAQGFTGILMQLGAAAQKFDFDTSPLKPFLDTIESVARRSLEEARRSVSTLRPRQERAEDFSADLERLVQSFRRRSDWRIRVHTEGVFHRSHFVGAEVLRIIEESLNNALRHAQAREVEIFVESAQSGGLRVSIADNGRGFDPNHPSRPGQFGLVSMQERAAKIGAVLTIASEIGRGTEVILGLAPPVARSSIFQPSSGKES